MTESLKTLYIVLPCSRKEITSFIEENHYSHNINGCNADYCFKLVDKNETICGAMFYGKLAMANQWKRFADNSEDVTELRRLVCIDDTPKNTESYFIGHTLRWLKKNTKLKVVVSYSDLEYGHTGVIYKASNFKCLGAKVGAKVIIFNGKRYHDKAVRTKYKGELKPFAIRIKDALVSGEAYYQETRGKVTFVYSLR